jgi:hypothetical protein
MTKVKIQEIPYSGWKNCVQITNGTVDLIVTVDVGPRIIRYGFVGQANEMCEIKSTMGLTGGNEWRLYGGHRLWHSPESKQRTYEPDNFPVQWKEVLNGIKTVQNEEPGTKIIKEMDIMLSSENSEVDIVHRLTNSGPWPVELSAWSITAMATGGTEVVPLDSTDTGLLPNRVLALWPYTSLNDPRIYFGAKYIILSQSNDMCHPLKFGISNENGWAAYFNHNHLFVKYYAHDKRAKYPDFGVSYETYTNDYMLEMETLSPLTLLEPGSHIEHVEKWTLYDNVTIPGNDESKIRDILLKMIDPSAVNRSPQD